MLYNPFEFALSDSELRDIGELLLTWSHTEQVVGYCLKAALKLDEDRAVKDVYPLSIEKRIHGLIKTRSKLNDDAQMALDAFIEVKDYWQAIRNAVAHCILIHDTQSGTLFHLRSKARTFTKDDVFECKELTLYCANVVMSLRYAIGLTNNEDYRKPLPAEKPFIPAALRECIGPTIAKQ